MSITAQNMPQTSNSLLSPTKSMIARGNQWAYVNHMCRLPVETYEDL